MKPKILKEEPVTMAEVKAELEAIQKKEKELTFRSQKTKEYLDRCKILPKKKIDELYKKLEGLEIPRIREIHIKKLLDILPTTSEDVKVALQGYTITVKEANLKAIAEAIKAEVPEE